MGVDDGDRGRGAGAGDLHADAGLRARLPGVRGQASGRCSRATDGRPHATSTGRSSTTPTARLPRTLARGRRALARSERGERRSTRAAARSCGRSATPAGCATRAAAHGGARETLDVRTLCLAARDARAPRRPRRLRVRDAGARRGPITLFGTDDAARRYLPRGRRRRGDRGVRALRARRRLGRRGACDHRARDGDGWSSTGEDVDLQRRDRRLLHGVRAHRRAGAASAAFVVDADTPGLQIAERIEVIAPHPLGTARVRGLPRAGASCSVRRARACKVALAHARRLPLDGRRGGARLRPARARRGAARVRARGSVRRRRWPTCRSCRRSSPRWRSTIDASALLVYRAAWTKDVTGGRVTREAAMAKLHATETRAAGDRRRGAALRRRGRDARARTSSGSTARSARCGSTRAPARSSS